MTSEVLMEENDGVIGCLPNFIDPIHAKEIKSAVSRIPELINSGNSYPIEFNYLKYSRLLHLYQEQPNLLDSVIPEIIEKLVTYIKLVNKKCVTQLDNLSREALKYIADLCVVRGRKTIVKLLPHEVTLLELLLNTLESYSIEEHNDHSQRNILLLWLWIVVRNPFDLKRFDPTGDPHNVIKRIMTIGMNYMRWDWNTSQYSASLVIAQCLTRTDGMPMIPEFLTSLLNDIKENESNQTKLLSNLILLLAILKHVDRTALLKNINQIHESIEFLYPINEKRGSLICKCLVKVVQRIGLVALKPRVCNWSYRRGKRLLNEMINEQNGDMEVDDTDWQPNQVGDDEIEDSEIVEWALSNVLNALSHSDTATRWSAAKGVGRITTRLQHIEYSQQIVETILENHFGKDSEYSSWHFHGGCLALGELARRGVLLPALLDIIIPVMEKALTFEDPMGKHQNANQVRDAACYSIWAFMRTYESAIMEPYNHRIVNALLCCGLFDREVNLRRAASAALQETVGRQKKIAHGISLITIVDYFSVSNRQKCYEYLCPIVARFHVYSNSMLDHLLSKKILHWDEKIRELAALSLEKISSLNIDGVSDNYYQKVLHDLVYDCCNITGSPVRRHGQLLALGHLLKGLDSRNVHIPSDLIQQVINIPNLLAIQTDRLSSTGSMLRKAVCELIRLLSETKFLELPGAVASEWAKRLVLFVKDTSEETREVTKAAAKSFGWKLLKNNKEQLKKLTTTCLLALERASDEYDRIGMCMLIEVLPDYCIDDEVIYKLTDVILKRSLSEVKWAVARKHSLNALKSLLVNLEDNRVHQFTPLLFATFYRALGDYTTSAKGDIGRFVREASMNVMADVIVSGKLSNEHLDEHLVKCLRLMIQQSAERIGRTRQCAANCVRKLLDFELIRDKIPDYSLLRIVFSDPESFILDNNVEIMKVLLDRSETYYGSVILGLVVSAGAIGEGTQKTAKKVLLDHQMAINNSRERMDVFLRTCAQQFRRGEELSRIGSSYLHILAQVFRHLGIYEKSPDESEYIVEIVTSLKKHVSKTGKMMIKRLAIEALAEILNCEKESKIYEIAQKLVIDQLSSEIPVVRKIAAEKLYEHLCCAEDADDDALMLLSETYWHENGTEKELKKVADQIEEKLRNC